MNKANNERHQDTERRIREAPLYFTEQDIEPSVADICARADINRSTFYRHYVDIFDLMEKTESEIQRGLFRSFGGEMAFSATENPADLLVPMIRYIGENRHFYRTYMRTHLGSPMENGFARIWEERIRPAFEARGVRDKQRMIYYYEMERAAFMTALRLWLEKDCQESPEEMAEVLSRRASLWAQTPERK